MQKHWSCPECGRRFTRKNQRHACGTGDTNDALRNRPENVVQLYASIESFVRSLGPVEFMTRKRYVLLRNIRIFADLVIMTDAVRVAVHLGRRVENPIFFKVVAGNKTVSHVAKLRKEEDFSVIRPYLKEAYEFSLNRYPHV